MEISVIVMILHYIPGHGGVGWGGGEICVTYHGEIKSLNGVGLAKIQNFL